MKIAIVHDDLMRIGGAEQVVLSMLKAFPQADLFTLCYRPKLTYPEFKNFEIHTSLFNFFSKNEKIMKILFFPLGLISMKLLPVKGYDIVLISSTYCAKYVHISKTSKIFIYTYTPFRLAWNPTSYKEYKESTAIKRLIYNLVVNALKRIDAKAARKGDNHISMTEETAERVRVSYGVKDVSIIHPPVKCHNFKISLRTDFEYYLIVSRLEYYKQVDLAIKAFNDLGKKLVVVGNGSKRKELMELANDNIEFKNGLAKEQLADLYANCKAFIFPQHEDYGITPLEANASGRPVIAYGQGGVLETMVPYTGSSSNYTALFFNSQTVDSLKNAINKFEALEVDSNFIRNHALTFDEPVFIKKLSGFIKSKL